MPGGFHRHHGLQHLAPAREVDPAAACRHNLKYNYWRTTPPGPTWKHNPDFDITDFDWRITEAPSFRQQFRDSFDAAEMFLWLSGRHDKFKVMGGQGWPMPGNRLERQYGIPEGIE